MPNGREHRRFNDPAVDRFKALLRERLGVTDTATLDATVERVAAGLQPDVPITTRRWCYLAAAVIQPVLDALPIAGALDARDAAEARLDLLLVSVDQFQEYLG